MGCTKSALRLHNYLIKAYNYALKKGKTHRSKREDTYFKGGAAVKSQIAERDHVASTESHVHDQSVPSVKKDSFTIQKKNTKGDIHGRLYTELHYICWLIHKVVEYSEMPLHLYHKTEQNLHVH